MKASLKISTSTLNSLIAELDVQLVSFTECLVSPGCRLNVRAYETPCMYYVMEGSGLMHFRGDPPLAVAPHSLIIVPPNYSFGFSACEQNATGEIVVVDGLDPIDRASSVSTFSAGTRSPKTIIFCVFFRTLYCKSIGLFETLSEPVVAYSGHRDR